MSLIENPESEGTHKDQNGFRKMCGDVREKHMLYENYKCSLLLPQHISEEFLGIISHLPLSHPAVHRADVSCPQSASFTKPSSPTLDNLQESELNLLITFSVNTNSNSKHIRLYVLVIPLVVNPLAAPN